MRLSRGRRARLDISWRRRLRVESLEDRRVLSAAAPWQNTPLPLDVNHDSIVENVDALIIINRLLQVGISALPALPEGTLPANYYDTNGDNMLSPGDALRAINSRLKPNTLVLDALMPFTADVTPRLLVQAGGTGTIADGATVHIDVDLDNDGQYVGNEIDYMTTTIYEGRSEFALTPALPVDGPSGIYSINLRARVPNTQGAMQGSGSVPLQVDTQTSDALYNYVNAPDDSYHYSLASTTVDPSGLFTYYVIDMTSQTCAPATSTSRFGATGCASWFPPARWPTLRCCSFPVVATILAPRRAILSTPPTSPTPTRSLLRPWPRTPSPPS